MTTPVPKHWNYCADEEETIKQLISGVDTHTKNRQLCMACATIICNTIRDLAPGKDTAEAHNNAKQGLALLFADADTFLDKLYGVTKQ